MSKNKSLREVGMEEKRPSALERLREEITILRIEGTLFCFDPKEARRRTGIITNTIKDADGTERPVSIEIHPSYGQDRKSTRLNSSHANISYAVFCLKKKTPSDS